MGAPGSTALTTRYGPLPIGRAGKLGSSAPAGTGDSVGWPRRATKSGQGRVRRTSNVRGSRADSPLNTRASRVVWNSRNPSTNSRRKANGEERAGSARRVHVDTNVAAVTG